MLIPLFLTFFINNSHARELYQLGNLSWIPRRNEFVHAFQYSKVSGKKKMVDALFMSNTNKVEATDYRWNLQYGLTNRLRIGLLQNGSFSSLSNDENGNKTSSNGHNTPQLMTFYRVLEQYPAFINIDLFFKYTPDFGKAQLGTRSNYKSGGEIYTFGTYLSYYNPKWEVVILNEVNFLQQKTIALNTGSNPAFEGNVSPYNIITSEITGSYQLTNKWFSILSFKIDHQRPVETTLIAGPTKIKKTKQTQILSSLGIRYEYDNYNFTLFAARSSGTNSDLYTNDVFTESEQDNTFDAYIFEFKQLF